MPGYWSTHEYHRMAVTNLQGWLGWTPFMKLVGLSKGSRERAFICASFATGGRITEVLALRKSNFEVLKDQGIVLIKGMALKKRYRKVEAITKEDGSKGWLTEPVLKSRAAFPIVMAEPTTGIVLDWLGGIQDLLFESPYRDGPLSRFWGYNVLRELDRGIDPRLREELGLTKGMHLWPHMLRSLRASQLNEDYSLGLEELLSFYSWESLVTARRYARKSWRSLASLMSGKVSYV